MFHTLPHKANAGAAIPLRRNSRPRADFALADHGSITLLEPRTQSAEDWIDANLPDDRMTWGRGVVIEPRYVGAIIEGLVNDGLTVEA